MEKKVFIDAIKRAKEIRKKRNFLESVEIAVNFRNIDFKRPENRIEVEVVLPKGRGKGKKVALIADKGFASEAKQSGVVDGVLTKEEVQSMSRKEGKALANRYDFFVAEPSVMVVVGKTLGPVLGPRRKMPRPVPPNIKALEATVKNLKNTVILSNKRGKYMPVVHAPIGVVDMSDEDLADNAVAVVNAIMRKLPSGEQNIKSIYVKTSMGPAVKVM